MGGAGQPDLFQSAERLAMELVPLYRENAASALAAIASGAHALGRWSAVYRYASMALPLARQRLDRWAEATALDLLAAVEKEGPAAAEGEPDASALYVSRRLAARLYRWRGQVRRRAPGHVETG